MITDSVATLNEDLAWEHSEIPGGFFHISCVDRRNGFGGSGFHSDLLTAKTKAFCEMNERRLVSVLRSQPLNFDQWGLAFDDSCSGFAVGLSRSKAILRAVCEGVERWTLSQWIDYGKGLNKLGTQVPGLHLELETHFQDYSVLHKLVTVPLNGRLLTVHVSVVLGFTDTGIFAGYGAKTDPEKAVQHAAVESLRNYLIFKNQPERFHFPYDRIFYFGRNKKAGQDALRPSSDITWSMPSLRLLQCQSFDNLWLARAIFDGWEPWQLGPRSRFLY